MRNQKGQVTIFIIVGVLIIAAAVLLFLFWPEVTSTLGLGGSANPESFLENCLEENIRESIAILSLQGGTINPEHYFLYKDSKIEYLCYQSEYHLPCVMQQPMLKSHIELEIENSIASEVDKCFGNMVDAFSSSYDVSLSEGDFIVELLPRKIVLSFGNELTLSRGATERRDSLRVVLNSDLYDLISIANSILNWEARYGDAETTIYMNYYRDLNVQKYKQIDGTTIYVLTNRDSGDKFQFASRSVAWPPGYGIGSVLI